MLTDSESGCNSQSYRYTVTCDVQMLYPSLSFLLSVCSDIGLAPAFFRAPHTMTLCDIAVVRSGLALEFRSKEVSVFHPGAGWHRQ